MAETLVIIPTYNEIGSLATILGRVRQTVPAAHVVIIDDSSPDGTGNLAENLATHDSFVEVIHRTTKDGLGRAYLEGFRFGLDNGYQFIVEIDADGSHDPASLPAMLALARDGVDLVLGSRWVPGGAVINWPWARQLISRAGNTYARRVLGSDIQDLTTGFRVFRAESLVSLSWDAVASQGYCFQIEVAWLMERAGYTVMEYPITFVERSVGRSKMQIGIVFEALARVTMWGMTRRRR